MSSSAAISAVCFELDRLAGVMSTLGFASSAPPRASSPQSRRLLPGASSDGGLNPAARHDVFQRIHNGNSQSITNNVEISNYRAPQMSAATVRLISQLGRLERQLVIGRHIVKVDVASSTERVPVSSPFLQPAPAAIGVVRGKIATPVCQTLASRVLSANRVSNTASTSGSSVRFPILESPMQSSEVRPTSESGGS
jgi:hypothetical protein